MSAEGGNLDLDSWWEGDGVKRTDLRFLFLIVLCIYYFFLAVLGLRCCEN